MPLYAKVKPQGSTDPKSEYVLQVTDNHTEASAKEHIERYCPGVEYVGPMSAEEYAAMDKPAEGKPVQSPTRLDGINPPVLDSAGPTPPTPAALEAASEAAGSDHA